MARILVVEDDPHVVTLLTELLWHEGHDVEVAADGLIGLLKLRSAAVDAVLLDVMMPDVDGTRMLRQVLEEHDDELPVPILVVTGSPEGARTCRDLLGPDRVFEKPFDPTALLQRLAEVLRPEVGP
jgi:DNA-binding response OmpR family regulator